MRPQDIITKKRDGKRLSAEEISSFILGVTDGSWADYQISAMLMAMYLNELDTREQAAITRSMLNSGEVLNFSELEKPKADKHSTGGVGDKTSLIIAPLVASCGVAVPMISGRGLGHTGGTLDKLESISGFNVDLSTDDFKRIVGECGYAMTGQTKDIVPADKKIYSLRDATATVSTIPLIVASIMSKKLAEGLDALVLDVKTGDGAFMKDHREAKRLAESMVNTGNSFGVKTKALITDMNQPLGKFVGNALEVYECVKVLRNEMEDGMGSMLELSLELSSQMLILAGVSDSVENARGMLARKLESGEAFEKFSQNVFLQGGDRELLDKPEKMFDRDLIRVDIKSNTSGFITGIKTKQIGNAICSIGGGRMKAEDSIDPAVGYSSNINIGDEVTNDSILGTLYCRNADQAESISSMLRSSYVTSPAASKAIELIKETVG